LCPRHVFDDEMREVGLARDRTQHGEFGRGETHEIARIGMRIGHRLEFGLLGRGRQACRTAEQCQIWTFFLRHCQNLGPPCFGCQGAICPLHPGLRGAWPTLRGLGRFTISLRHFVRMARDSGVRAMNKVLEIGAYVVASALALGGGFVGAEMLFTSDAEPGAATAERAAPPPGTAEIRNDRYGFSFRYPQDWGDGPRYHESVMESV